MFTKILKNRQSTEMPKHVAIIMDGNGRWAKKRYLPRVAGHKEGMETVRKITKAANKLGIKVLTLYAFSTENWKRPENEVNFLMKLPITFFNKFIPELIKENVKVNVMGNLAKLPKKTQKAVLDAISQTESNTGMILNFALNYGSRLEIVEAVKVLAKKVKKDLVDADKIDEDMFSKELMTATLPIPDPDLLIRTSGEQRISNFLLWQIAYSELIFSDILWPDYSEKDLINDISKYQKRNRRFGGLT